MEDNLTTPEQLQKIDAYWRAANDLSVGQIYLCDNPLLRRPLALADVKLKDKLVEHRQYIEQHGEDIPEVRGWQWGS